MEIVGDDKYNYPPWRRYTLCCAPREGNMGKHGFFRKITPVDPLQSLCYNLEHRGRVRSSGGERLTHIQEAAGSKPAAPTK